MDELKSIDKQKISFLYCFNFFTICFQDYDKYYLELLKNAIKYGMKSNEFWNNDIQEYYAYEEAYIERLHEQTHLQGLYNHIALECVVSEILSKPQDVIRYPKENEYQTRNKQSIYKSKKQIKITKDNLDKVFANRLSECY